MADSKQVSDTVADLLLKSDLDEGLVLFLFFFISFRVSLAGFFCFLFFFVSFFPPLCFSFLCFFLCFFFFFFFFFPPPSPPLPPLPPLPVPGLLTTRDSAGDSERLFSSCWAGWARQRAARLRTRQTRLR